MKEEWKKIPGFPYDASSLGGVRNRRTRKILKPTPNHAGYLRVTLCEGGNESHKRVHRLVAETFLGPCPDGKQVNHKDGDKKNNRVSNLEYCTPRENLMHGYYSLGVRGSKAKLTLNDAKQIRRQGMKIKKGKGGRRPRFALSRLALEYGVTTSAISDILEMRTWNREPQ